jgi:hypothetical protein
MRSLFDEIYEKSSYEQTNFGISEQKALELAQKAFEQYWKQKLFTTKRSVTQWLDT